LAGVIPLVESLAGIEALIALETDEVGLQNLRQNLGYFRLTNAGFALEKERSTQAQAEKRRDRQATIGYVAGAGERGHNRFDGFGDHSRSLRVSR
jgi:hypothetical protein